MNLTDALDVNTEVSNESRRTCGFVSRRRLMWGGLAALLGQARRAEAAPPRSQTRFLVNRLTFGWTPEEQLLADTLGYHGYLEYHLNPESIDDSAMDDLLAGYTSLVKSIPELFNGIPAWRNINQLVEATILRAVFSKRQLFERMVEFWTDHFNIDILKSKNQALKVADDRDVVRANALGTFPDILRASAHSPAMQVYLDNFTSVAGNPNENYARELMELHTLGVDAGYTQQDVVEVARCFTGWGVWAGNGDATTNWTFLFQNHRHDNGQKVVLGNVIPAGGGYNDGLIVLDILANHPACAAFIAKKLCRRFWSDDPPQTLIDAVAATYTATSGDIRAMLRTLFTTLDPAQADLRLKRPFHLFVSALRALKADIIGDPGAGGSALRAEFAGAGHEPFHWVQPDGYPDRADAWVDQVLPRWNFAAKLLGGLINNASVDVSALAPGATTADEVIDAIDSVLFGGTMPTGERTAVRDYLAASPVTEARIREGFALAVSAPSYQMY